MTQQRKLYLVGKGSKEKLTQQFGTDVENNRLPVALRDQIYLSGLGYGFGYRLYEKGSQVYCSLC